MRYEFAYHPDGELPTNDEIFVFGSNLAGRHGAGAAKAAIQFGARMGIGIGLEGQSYAIPTKGAKLETLSIDTISSYVNEFCKLTHAMSDSKFFVTRVGCGLAGHLDENIAPLFARCNRHNTIMPLPWRVVFHRI